MDKKLLFSVTMKDLEMTTFTVQGGGGQRKDRKEVGVRLFHKASGASEECRDTRYQNVNKERAFVKLANSSKFKAWHKLECAKRLGQKTPKEIVDEEMQRSEHFKIEERNKAGLWKESNA